MVSLKVEHGSTSINGQCTSQGLSAVVSNQNGDQLASGKLENVDVSAGFGTSALCLYSGTFSVPDNESVYQLRIGNSPSTSKTRGELAANNWQWASGIGG